MNLQVNWRVLTLFSGACGEGDLVRRDVRRSGEMLIDFHLGEDGMKIFTD
jgi:hypothetical protein